VLVRLTFDDCSPREASFRHYDGATSHLLSGDEGSTLERVAATDVRSTVVETTRNG